MLKNIRKAKHEELDKTSRLKTESTQELILTANKRLKKSKKYYKTSASKYLFLEAHIDDDPHNPAASDYQLLQQLLNMGKSDLRENSRYPVLKGF